MEVYERIRFLRKNILKMTQTEFAEHLGVTRTVIKNIELNSLARPDQKLSLYKLICSEFNVREEWLLNNEGEIYENNKIEFSELIERIMSGENEFAKNIFKTFAKFIFMNFEKSIYLFRQADQMTGFGRSYDKHTIRGRSVICGLTSEVCFGGIIIVRCVRGKKRNISLWGGHPV